MWFLRGIGFRGLCGRRRGGGCCWGFRGGVCHEERGWRGVGVRDLEVVACGRPDRDDPRAELDADGYVVVGSEAAFAEAYR